MLVYMVIACCGVALVSGLDNGLALTPPMAWLSWERFRCNLDCDKFNDTCISEHLYKTMADHVAADGYLEAGYEYVIMDDCWLAPSRDSEGRLQPDPKRFPSGIKALAEYIHSKGLKFGIYEDFGTHTCAGYPGSEYYLQMDAQTFADWGVDYLKFDGCYNTPQMFDRGYPPMAFFLQKTGRPIVLSCEYPVYHPKTNYTKLSKVCNLARNTRDIQDSWESVKNAIKIYGDDKLGFAEVAGPGFWNDPDMLVIGDYGLSYEQQRAQMGMWAIMASPLIMSNDLRTIRKESKDILLNRNVIAINQDKMGKQGKRVMSTRQKTEVWVKPILPAGSVAFAYLYTGDQGTPMEISYKLSDMGVNAGSYNVTEVFSGEMMGVYKSTDKFTAAVPPSGIFLGKAVPINH